jgi:hypothetical protein
LALKYYLALLVLIPNKSKRNQGNPNKKAWISLDSFGRIGAFQWVTANPNKKIFPSFSPGAECLKPSSGQARAFLSAGKDIACILDK